MEQTDGNAGARRAVALLTIAARAETASASLAEEASKIDIKFTFNHAFKKNISIAFFAQVKSGPSYVRDTKKYWKTLNVDKETIEALFSAGVCSLIIWVPPRPQNRVYWQTSRPRSRLSTPVRLEEHQFISPSIKYDLTRFYEHITWSQTCPKLQMAALNPVTLMDRARSEYKKLKSTNRSNSVVGPFEVTRLAWRHVTRRSNSVSKREVALRTVPYLKNFLHQPPDRFVRNHISTSRFGPITVESRDIVCWYREALIMDGVTCSLMVRFREDVSYPSGWEVSSLSDKHVSQKATLSSWWCKPIETRPAS